MIRMGAVITIATLLCTASLVEAHMPDRCRRLLLAAERETRNVARKNKSARALIKRKELPDRLMEAAEKLLRAMAYQNMALGKVLNCIAKFR